MLLLNISWPSEYKHLSTKLPSCHLLLFNGSSFQSQSGPTHLSGYRLQGDIQGQLCCQTFFKGQYSKCPELNKFSVIKRFCLLELICFFLCFSLRWMCRRNRSKGSDSLLLLLFTVDRHCFEYQWGGAFVRFCLGACWWALQVVRDIENCFSPYNYSVIVPTCSHLKCITNLWMKCRTTVYYYN